jgi:hypothetical protein
MDHAVRSKQMAGNKFGGSFGGIIKNVMCIHRPLMPICEDSSISLPTFDTKASAEAWARQIEAEMDRGVFVSRKE